MKRNLLTRSSMCIYLSTFDSLLMGIRNLFVFSVHRTRGVCAAPYFNNFYYVTDYLYRNSSGWVPVLVPLESDRKCMKFQMVDERTKKTTTIVYLRFSVGCGCCCCFYWWWWWFTLKFRVCSRKFTRLFIGWVYLIYSFIIMCRYPCLLYASLVSSLYNLASPYSLYITHMTMDDLYRL